VIQNIILYEIINMPVIHVVRRNEMK